MNELQWVGAFLQFFLWMVPVFLLAKIAYSLSPTSDKGFGLLPLLASAALTFVSMLFGAWWYNELEFYFNDSVLICHAIENGALLLVLWAALIIVKRLEETGHSRLGEAGRKSRLPSFISGAIVFAASGWFVFIDRRTFLANLDLIMYAASFGILTVLFVGLGSVAGAVHQNGRNRRHHLAYGAAALLLLSNVVRAYLFAFHGSVPFAEAMRVGRELAAVVTVVLVYEGVNPAIRQLIGRAKRATVETPFQRRKAETQKRLTTAFLVMVLFLGALIAAMLESIYGDVQMIERAHVEQQTKVARTLTVNADSSLSQLTGILKEVAGRAAVEKIKMGGMEKIFRHLPHSWDEDIMAIARIDSTGRIVYAYPQQGRIVGKSIVGRPHVRYLLEHREPIMSAPFRTMNGKRVVAMLYPVFSNGIHGGKVFTGGVGLIVAGKVLSDRMFPNVSVLNSSPVAAVNMYGKVITESSGNHAGDSAGRYLRSIYRNDTSARSITRAVKRILHVSGLSLVPVGSGRKAANELVVAAPLNVSGNHLGAMIVPIRSYLFTELYRHAVSNEVRLWSYLLAVFAGMTGVLMFVYHRWSGFLEGEVKREREVVRETEGHYTKLFHSARLGIFRTDAEGAFTAANPALAAMLGYHTPEKLLGRKVLHPDVLRSFSLGETGQSADAEPVRLLTIYGVPVYVRLSCGIKRDAEGKLIGYEGFVEDVTESHLVHEKIRDSEKRYSELFRLSPAGMYVTTEEGKILEVNDSLADMFGYESADELLRLPVSVLYSESYPREEFFRELRKSGSVNNKIFAAKKKDGSSVYVYENAELAFDPVYDREVIRGAMMDVTELMLLQQQVDLHRKVAETSSEVLAAAFQGGDVGEVFEKSIASIGKNLELQGVMVLGRDENEVKSLRQWWADDASVEDPAGFDWKALEESFPDRPSCRVIEKGEKDFEENVLVRDYGPQSYAVTSILSKDELWGFLVLIDRSPERSWTFPEKTFLESAGKLLSSVVERNYEAEFRSRLEEQRDELLLAFEQLAEAVVFSDINGIIRYVNSTFTKLTGFSREDVLGKNTEILRSEEHDRAFFERLWKTIMSGNVFRARFKSRRKDGSIVYLDKTIAPVIDSAGKVTSFVEVSSDVTEQISLEEQLAQSQKMESIGLLAGGIAHDFNNILGAILGYASLVKGRIDQSHEFYKYIDTIERSATRAADLTSQLLAFARGGKYNVVPVSMNRIVNDTLRIVRSTFDKSIVIRTDLGTGLSYVEADPGQMHQVVMNLCVNARDAMPDGGVLSIFTRDVELSEKDTVSNVYAVPGRYVMLSVSDNGTGMDESTVKRIFEPFFSTKEKGKGTGLGLSMVYGIVRNHGGFVDVDSQPGQGTTFRIYYPASGKDHKEEKEEGVMSKLEGGTETVLVAEDEQSMRELVIDILDSGGYKVIAVEDGEGAVKTYAERKDEIDLVILDMIMPKLNGSETFRQLKAMNKDVRVLLSSGYSQDGQAQDLLSEGVAGFIGKPYQVAELLEKVRSVLEAK